MAVRFQIVQHVFQQGMTTMGEPFSVVGPDEDGDFLIFTALPIETGLDPSKASEVIGSLEPSTLPE